MEADIIDLGNDIPDTRDISHGTPEPAANTLNLDFVMLIDEVNCTIANRKCSDLTPVLDKLDTDTFPDRRVRLLGLNSYLLEDYPAPLWRTF
jgi:hypothetical protein